MTADAPSRQAPVEEQEPLRRELSRIAIAALVVNGLVGAGIFGLPDDAYRLTGAFSPLIFVICGLLMSTVLLSFAQASSYFNNTGGPILFTQTAFGSFVGFQTGWAIYVGRATSLAANSNLLATYLAAFVPGVDQGPGRIAVILTLALFFATANIVGVKQGMRSVMAITIVKFVPLLVFVLVGLTFLRVEPFASAVPPDYRSFGAAVLAVFYAFIGFEGALIPAGESRNPKRDMPRALIATAGATTLLYCLIQLVSVAVMPDLGASERPLADAAGIMMGAFGVFMIAGGAVISILGNYAASALSAPRMTYALARDGALPSWFASVHERFLTPHISVAFYCTVAVLLGVTGTFRELAEMSSLARILGYAACIASVPRLARMFAGADGEFRIPGSILATVGGLVICVWLMAQAQIDAVWKTAVLVGVGTLLYFGNRLVRSRKESQ